MKKLLATLWLAFVALVLLVGGGYLTYTYHESSIAIGISAIIVLVIYITVCAEVFDIF